MIALMVTLKVKPDQREEFLKAAEVDSIGSNRDEPGCYRFDVLQDSEDENTYYFYEVYRDDAAFDAHRAAPHYAVWREASQHVLAGATTRHLCSVLFPRDYK